MNLLTGSAMAVLRVQWLFTAQLVLNLATVTAGLVANFEVLLLVVNLIRWPMLPFVKLSLSRAQVPVIAIGVVGSVGHGSLL